MPPPPPPPSEARPATHRKTEKERQLDDGSGGAQLYDAEKAWPSINHSILSAWLLLPLSPAPGAGDCSPSIKWFVEDQAFPPSYDLTPPPPPPPSKLDRPHTGRLRKRDNLLTGEGILRRRESLALCKLFNTLCLASLPLSPATRCWQLSSKWQRESLVLYKSFNTLCSTPLAIVTFEPGHQVLATVLQMTARKPCPL